MPDTNETKDGGAPSAATASPSPTTTQQAAATPPAAGTGGASGGVSASKDDGGKADVADDPKMVSIGDDEYQLDAKGYINISAQTFKRRLSRYSAKQLKDTFGTDDVADIKARLDEHGKLKAQSEEQRRKQLAKEEQLAEDLKRERELRTAAESKAEQLAEEREYREADSDVRKAAEKYIQPGKFSKLAVVEFAEYVRDLDDDDARKLKDKDVDAWFRQYAEDNAELAKGAKPGKPDEEKEKPARKPMSHGAGGAGADPPATPQNGGKTPKPGTPTTMTDAEYKALKRSQGINA